MKNTLLVLLLICTAGSAVAENEELIIDYTKYQLDNGLTLIVHQDKKAPVVAVNIWYHVGSKDEKPGRTGFAHLFEHLMFNGSENYNDDYFKPFDRVGVSGMNGTTNQDRTNYFEVVPKNALEMALWMESDRMGHLLGAIDQAKLDEQRAVVQNEKRQGENQPYGRVFGTILENVYPKGHPYSWNVIGSMEDLNAASVEDVHEWFKTKYGAANATLVLSGDIEPENAKTLTEKYFGHIEAGPPMVRQTEWIAKRSGKHIQTMYDRVPQARVYKIWNIPSWGNQVATDLDMVSSVLSSDKKSRLYNRLVYKERVASDVSAFSFNSEIGGLFGIVASAIDPDKLDYIEQAIDEELAAFSAKGPTREELSRIKTSAKASFVRGMERIGGFGGKSDILARNQVFAGDPNHYLKSFERIAEASARDLMTASKEWLSDGEYVLRVLPYQNYTATAPTIDRSTGIPPIGPAPKVTFDEFERTTLSNGLSVILAQRNAVPVIRMNLLINAGFSSDASDKAGTANLAMSMLDEGTTSRDALEISADLSQMGTSVNSGAGLDSSQIRLNTLTENLDKSLAIYADVILNPSFPEAELTRLKAQQLTSIAQEKSTPFGLGFRLLPKVLFGGQHPYSKPFSGSGNTDSVSAMTVEDLREYHDTWFKTGNANLIVVGDIDMQTLKPKLEKAFAKMPKGNSDTKEIGAVAPIQKSTVYLVNRPDSAQSAIIAASMMPKYGFDDELPLKLVNEVLGDSFVSRLNMNLREDKGWAYGAYSSVQNTQAQRPFNVRAPVQTDKTAESMQEIYNELRGISGNKPANAEELERSLDKRTLTLPSRWETAGSVEGDIATMVRYGLADDYWDSYVSDLRSVNLEMVNKAAKQYIDPDKMVWLVVGDLAKIEKKVRDLGFGDVVVLDAQGAEVSN